MTSKQTLSSRSGGRQIFLVLEKKPQHSAQNSKTLLKKSMAFLRLLLTWCTESLFYISSMDQWTLSLIVVREIIGVYAHHCKAFITNEHVDYWIHGNNSTKIPCTDYAEWKQHLFMIIVIPSISRFSQPKFVITWFMIQSIQTLPLIALAI